MEFVAEIIPRWACTGCSVVGNKGTTSLSEWKRKGEREWNWVTERHCRINLGLPCRIHIHILYLSSLLLYPHPSVPAKKAPSQVSYKLEQLVCFSSRYQTDRQRKRFCNQWIWGNKCFWVEWHVLFWFNKSSWSTPKLPILLLLLCPKCSLFRDECGMWSG